VCTWPRGCCGYLEKRVTKAHKCPFKALSAEKLCDYVIGT
jgi:hypothetical protein